MYCFRGICGIISSLTSFESETNLEIIDYLNRMMNNFGVKKLRKIEQQGIEWVNIIQ